MGMLIDGQWREAAYAAGNGEFLRRASTFRRWVSADGASGYPAEAGRYHLYVSLACPWAHRTLIVRALKGLELAIGVSVVDPFMGADGWTFSDRSGCVPDSVNHARHMRDIYLQADPGLTGRVTVPVLWDRVGGTIVNNESSEIMRMLNTEFDAFATRPLADLYPPALRPEIDHWNTLVYDTVNNGVYRAGFATAQDKYEAAVRTLFATLDMLERHLCGSRYLCGGAITEADWRLFTTLLRFDAVYHGHFKCNLRRLVDYPHLWAYTRALYQTPGVAATVDMAHIKEHYYRSHSAINPTGIVPVGPVVDFDAPHQREAIGAA